MRSLIAGVLLAAPVLANAYTWQQTIDFNPDPQLTSFESFSYTQDLTTDGFNPGSDTISDYTLTINLYNEQGTWDVVYIDQPGITGDSGALLYNWSYVSLTTGDSYQGLASLNQSGLLDVSIWSIGNFFLDSSTLVANGTQDVPTSSVPEPTSIALLAAGLFGIAVMRRKQQS